MCGIAGIFNLGKKSARLSLEDCEDFRGILTHRGPDNFQYYNTDKVTLFHWRLAILDLSAAGNQPMDSHCGKYKMVYNGEIYNTNSLTKYIAERTNNSPIYRSRTDSEVILQGFAQFGVKFLKKLNGMFAGCIYDVQNNSVFLFRDRAGIKPLYYFVNKGQLCFASEIKALKKFNNFDNQIKLNGVAAFLHHGHCYSKNRIYNKVRTLTPGFVFRFSYSEKSGVKKHKASFCDVRRPKQNIKSLFSAKNKLRNLLFDVVEKQLVSDRDIGVFLSGGVDSAILTAIASEILGPKNTKAFTLSYTGKGQEYDEINKSTSVAKHLGIDHTILKANSENLIDNIENLVSQYDEPFADGGALNMFILCKLIKKHLDVCLAGEGSDELFGGYRRYQLELFVDKHRRFLNLLNCIASVSKTLFKTNSRRFLIFGNILSSNTPSERYSKYFEGTYSYRDLMTNKQLDHTSINSVLGELIPGNSAYTKLSNMCYADQKYWLVDSYLEKTDKASMAWSLEVRVPFLDNRVVNFANSLSDNLRLRKTVGKYLLKETFKDLVPAKHFQSMKKGFAVPYADWLRKELKEYYCYNLLSDSSMCRTILNQQLIKELSNDHFANFKDNSIIMWRLLLLEIWLRKNHTEDCSNFNQIKHI